MMAIRRRQWQWAISNKINNLGQQGLSETS